MNITLQDAWGLASDRRFDNLEMPILDDPVNYGAKADAGVHEGAFLALTTDFPRQAGRFSDFLAGQNSKLAALPFEQRLSGVLRYLASPMRFEPLNMPDVHFPVSSFGGLSSCGIKFIRRHPTKAGFAQVFHFHGNYHALEKQIDELEWDGEIAQNQWLVTIVGQYWAVGRKYGDFAPFGVVLDSGIVLAQLQYLFRLFGFSFQTGFNTLNRLNDKLVPEGSFQQVLAAVTLDVPESANALLDNGEWEALEIATYQEPQGLMQRFGLLQDIVSLLACEFEQAWPAPLSLNVDKSLHETLPERDMLDVIYNRTASNDRLGFSQVNKMLDGEFLKQFMQVLQQLKTCRDRLPLEDSLMINVAWINTSGPAMGLYDEVGEPVCIAQDSKRFQHIIQDCLYSDNQKYNLSSMTLELFISVDTDKVSKSAGNSALRATHIAAGAVAHDVCLAASLFDAFARPARMFRDTKLQQRFGLDGQLLIQVLVGFNRYNNFALTIL